jgi:uncharacterized protein YecE (DUF72 family)
MEWKGSFYPEKLPAGSMLSFYANRFSTVEINYSFYHMPTEAMLLNWAKDVPEGFRFALKANQWITHRKRLRGCKRTWKSFLKVASVLTEADHLGPVLIQIPPTFRRDLPPLENFLAFRPPGFHFAFEPRHASWFTDETYAVLRRHRTALCLAETDMQTPPDVLTARFTYVRLRRDKYTPKQLAAWRERFNDWLRQGVDVYVYSKHDEEGKAPGNARKILGHEGKKD